VLTKNIIIVNHDVCAEWRIGDYDIKRCKAQLFARTVAPGLRISQAVRLKEPARPVVVHNHVHLSGANEARIEVRSAHTLGEIVVSSRPERLSFSVGSVRWINPFGSFVSLDMFERCVHCRNEEAASSASWVE